VSNALAIAAATRTLRSLLAAATPNVTVLPLDRARDAGTAEQLNLFLYQTVPAAAWRNSDPVGPGSGGSGQPPLALALRYLVTAYGEDEGGAHAVLGRAMGILHDHTVLGPQEIADATAVELPESDLHRQPEHPRITPVAVTTDDLFKLWSGFQTGYRISAAYELSVVLIDSSTPVRAALPVLRRGADDRGSVVVTGPAPVLTAVLPLDGAPSARLGGRVRLRGTGLGSAVSAVRFSSARLPAPVELPAEPSGTGEPTVLLPSGDTGADLPAEAVWAPGMFTVAVVTALPDRPRWVSNEVPLGLAPVITVAPTAAPPGDLTLTVSCLPRLRDGQRVTVLFGDGQVPPTAIDTPADPGAPSTVTAQLTGVAGGSYLVRLRVDGVDSHPVVLLGTPARPEFDPAQQVVVA
jgi:hypothetical protein